MGEWGWGWNWSWVGIGIEMVWIITEWYNISCSIRMSFLRRIYIHILISYQDIIYRLITPRVI